MIFSVYCLPDTVLIVLNNTYSRKEPGSKRWLDNLYNSEDRVLKIKCNRPRRPRTCVQLRCSSHRKNVLYNPNLLGMFCLLIFLYNPLFIVSSHRFSLYVVALCFAALFSPKKKNPLASLMSLCLKETAEPSADGFGQSYCRTRQLLNSLFVADCRAIQVRWRSFFRPNSLSAIHETHFRACIQFCY